MNDFYRQKILDNSIPEPNSGCWLWEKSVGSHGYGNFCHDYKITTAPRVSLKAFKCDDIPDGAYVLHKCDNRSCVNPDHLMWGTPKENNLQASARKRSRNGYGSMFGDDILRAQIIADKRPQRIIAEDHGISQTLVWKIKKKK